MNADHMDIAVTLYVLAGIILQKCDIDEAERLHRLSFEMRCRLDGPIVGNR